MSDKQQAVCFLNQKNKQDAVCKFLFFLRQCSMLVGQAMLAWAVMGYTLVGLTNSRRDTTFKWAVMLLEEVHKRVIHILL
jgi:hypothetical protein